MKHKEKKTWQRFNFGGSSAYYDCNVFAFYVQFIKSSDDLLLNKVSLFCEITINQKMYRKTIKSSSGKFKASFDASRIYDVHISKETVEKQKIVTYS